MEKRYIVLGLYEQDMLDLFVHNQAVIKLRCNSIAVAALNTSNFKTDCKIPAVTIKELLAGKTPVQLSANNEIQALSDEKRFHLTSRYARVASSCITSTQEDTAELSNGESVPIVRANLSKNVRDLGRFYSAACHIAALEGMPFSKKEAAAVNAIGYLSDYKKTLFAEAATLTSMVLATIHFSPGMLLSAAIGLPVGYSSAFAFSDKGYEQLLTHALNNIPNNQER